MKLHLKRERAALEPRNEPYWEKTPIGKQGRVLGYRKIDANIGTWVARMRDENNLKRYQKLGLDSEDFGYEQAYEAARVWFAGRDGGISDDEITVAEACREYVEDRLEKKGDACAHDAQERFKLYVYDKPFGACKVAKLRTQRTMSNGGAIPNSASNPQTALAARSRRP